MIGTDSSPEQQTLTTQQAIDLAVQHHNAGRLPEAESICQQILKSDPNQPVALHLLGVIAHQVGKHDIAVDLITMALAIKPDFADAYSNLGNALQGLGKLDEAVASFHKALAIKPDFAMAHNNLGAVLKELGKLDEAVASYHKALDIKPDFAEAHSNLGLALQELGKLDEAMASYHKALAIKPDYAEVHYNLGNSFKELGKLDEAVASYHKALVIKPDYAEAHNNLGNAFKDLGKLDEAVTSYHKALAIKPDYVEVHSNLIFTMLYFPSTTGGTILKEALRWDQQHGNRGEVAKHDNKLDPERLLRIGYVSGDFRQHAVSYLLEPLLAGHDHEEVELFCYAEVLRPDLVTERFKGHADHWRSTIGLSDEKLADIIRADMIDIVVDCTGHTANSRLRALTRKPAPVQVSHFSMYGSTSGVKAMDYVLSDCVLTPPGFEDQFSEEVVILPHGAFAFRPDPDWPEVETPPPTGGGPLFACVGDPVRIGPATTALWARLLEMVPGSRILFKHGAYGDPKTREAWHGKFKELGNHLIFEGVDGGWARNMDVYGRVDVVLDTLPMSGGSSCIIPLWMGVPVITMAGPYYGHRYGSAMVTLADMADFSAEDPEDYLRIASDLANDPERRTSLRHTMRDTIKASHILDARGCAADIEAAYRKMWRAWCEGVSRP